MHLTGALEAFSPTRRRQLREDIEQPRNRRGIAGEVGTTYDSCA
jgi:hypothetical protein